MLAILTQYHPSDTAAVAWPTVRHDVREYILSCATCQKMATRHKAIRVSRFVLSTPQPMRRIELDTIRLLEISHQFRYILVIDTFTRYVELFPTKNVTVEEATDALWRHPVVSEHH